MTIQTAKLRKIISPAATLRAMKKGEMIKISTKDIKTASIRNAAVRLRKDGYDFRVSEAGLINETLVNCLKSPL